MTLTENVGGVNQIETEYDEPTDEREMTTVDTDNKWMPTATTTTTDTGNNKASSVMLVEEGLDNVFITSGATPPPTTNPVTTTGTTTQVTEHTHDEPTNQIRMKVAADAPWKDRMWEGR
jgi:hypothetical protein